MDRKELENALFGIGSESLAELPSLKDYPDFSGAVKFVVRMFVEGVSEDAKMTVEEAEELFRRSLPILTAHVCAFVEITKSLVGELCKVSQ